MRNLVAHLVVVQYGITLYYEVASCIGGNWFGFDLRVAVSLIAANTFVIIYLQLGRSK